MDDLGGTGAWDDAWGGAWGGTWGRDVVNIATLAASIMLRLCGYGSLSVFNIYWLIQLHGRFPLVNLIAASCCLSAEVLSFNIELLLVHIDHIAMHPFT